MTTSFAVEPAHRSLHSCRVRGHCPLGQGEDCPLDNWTDREERIIKGVVDRMARDPQFTPEEIETVRLMIQAYQGLRAFGWMTKWIVYALAATAASVAAWKVLVDGLRTWLHP